VAPRARPQASSSRNFLLARSGAALAVAGSRRPGGGRRLRLKELARRRRPCLPACLISSYRQPHGWAYGPRPRWWAREMRRAALGARARNGITQRARDREGGHFPLGPAAGGLCRRRCGRACLPALPLPVEKGRGATSCLVCVLPGRLRGSGACRLGCSGVERPGFSGFFFAFFSGG